MCVQCEVVSSCLLCCLLMVLFFFHAALRVHCTSITGTWYRLFLSAVRLFHLISKSIR